jgi:hypothetical protein
MTAKNEHTGDEIKSRKNSDKYRDNFPDIFKNYSKPKKGEKNETKRA